MRNEQDKTELRKRIKNLNYEIRNYYRQNKGKKVRRNLVLGSSKSLWEAVKIAKDINNEKMPKEMFKDGTLVKTEDLAGCFADVFEDKINFFNQPCRD